MTDVLRDRDGNLGGIVMANRSGRQAVRAKVIIDATSRASATRIAAAEFAVYPAGKQTFKRIVVGGKPNQEAKVLPLSLTVESDSRRHSGVETYKVYEYTIDIPMDDSSWASFAAAERAARDRTWQDEQADASERLFQVPPDPVKGRKQQKGTWPSSRVVPTQGIRRPAGSPCPSWFWLGPCIVVAITRGSEKRF